jgi:tripartite-type tricarboxylate transporter receptor subunit TctC
MLAKRAGVRLVHVPYRGGGPSLNDAVAGHVDLISGTVAAVSGQVSAGALRPLLQTGLSRLPNLPDVPTADEFGFKGFEALTWWGCFGPSGVPKEISDRFANALADTLRDPPVNRQLSETLQIKFDIGGRDRLRSFLATQMRTWGAVVRENDIKAE